MAVARAGQVYGSPVLADGRIYYPARGGTVYVVAARPHFELLATNSWGERGTSNASPAVAGGTVVLSDRAVRLLCGKEVNVPAPNGPAVILGSAGA